MEAMATHKLVEFTIAPSLLHKWLPSPSSSSSSFPSSRIAHLAPPRRPRRHRPLFPFAPRLRPRRSSLACKASSDAPPQPEVYQGVYGPWSIDPLDVREVVLYRAGLVTTAVTFIVTASTAFLPDDLPVKSLIVDSSDVLYAVGAGGLGLSLLLIHIYVNPIKRALQLLWAVGVIGSIVVALNFAAPADEGLVEHILRNPTAVWFIGPLFAALTGLVFKEGLCYGKLEAASLVFVIPGLLLGHLSGLMDEKWKSGLLVAWMVLYTVFAARKFIQPVKDDIGDKSIFMFNALPNEEKNAFLQKMQEQPKRDGATE